MKRSVSVMRIIRWYQIINIYFRLAEVPCLADLADTVQKSTRRNINRPELLGDERGQVFVQVHDWKEYFTPFFRPIQGIKRGIVVPEPTAEQRTVDEIILLKEEGERIQKLKAELYKRSYRTVFFASFTYKSMNVHRLKETQTLHQLLHEMQIHLARPMAVTKGRRVHLPQMAAGAEEGGVHSPISHLYGERGKREKRNGGEMMLKPEGWKVMLDERCRQHSCNCVNLACPGNLNERLGFEWHATASPTHMPA
nr:hypothetical protein BaRGS_035224 [Batillaria attramentaria]